jgi:hypothetical protein
MASVVQVAGPAFGNGASPRSATATFATAPAAGSLVIGGFGGNKNTGVPTPPDGFTVRASYAQASVSGALATGVAVAGGEWTWAGQPEAAVALFELDVGAGWAYRAFGASAANETAVATVSADAGTAPVDGVAVALVAVDSSTAAGGPFSDAATVGFTGGFAVVGRYQEAAPYGGDAGGAAFVLGLKTLPEGDRDTATTASWSGGSDQACLLVVVVDLPAVAAGPEPGRMLIAY